MKKNFSRCKFAAVAIAAAVAFFGCSNPSDGGGEKQPNATDLAIAAAKSKYASMAGTWTKVDSQGKTNTLVIDSEKATLTFDNAGDYKRYFGEGTRYAAPKTTYSEYSMFLSEGKGVSTLGAATREAISLHPDYSQDLTTAVSSLMAGTGRNFNANDVCLYNVCTSKKTLTTKRNPYVWALALRITAEGKLEAMFFYSALKDSSPSFEETYSITFDKENSGGSSGGQSPSFSVVGSWKRQGEAQSGTYLRINSDSSFNMFKGGIASSLYTNCKATMSGSRITIKFKINNGGGNYVSISDVFEVSGTAQQMKWTLVSSETVTNSSGATTDTSMSAALQSLFTVATNEMTFVPY